MLANRIQKRAEKRNKELTIQAAVVTLMGVLWSLLVFGGIYALTWMVSFLTMPLRFSHSLAALIVMLIFLTVAICSAWKRVDLFAGLAPLTNIQVALTIVSPVMGNFYYSSPRHTTAGFAFVLLAGPLNLLEAIGLWNHRLLFDDTICQEAAELLQRCQKEISAKKIDCQPAAVVLLKRLALIKSIDHNGSTVVTATEKGDHLLKRSGL